ncbi:lysozyme inhibitor LprI family protein [Roseomonas sp. HF4]|uniref:lysozyme inhibitor LprI family protein n=1 Tax=Roseomonas sp. HF4 TaxID=2562313 RepID=UPI0014852945|nr:lysozyme inhibitor LprI family protein [Roseomonas sp. HF4]
MAHPARLPRWTGRRRAIALAVLAALLAGPALGQGRGPDPARPHGAERAWVEACVLSAQAHPPRAAFGRCAWRIAAACRGEPGEGLLYARLPALPDRPQTLPVCTLVETAIWQQQMDRWLREVGLLATAAAVEPLRRSQRAFLAWRDAACLAEAALSAPSEAEEHRLACRLEQTALRALELKRLRDEAWLAIATASAEDP